MHHIFTVANYPEDVVEHLPQSFDTGIYYGWACVDRGDVHKMVLSVGWNPFYNNKKKSMVSLCIKYMFKLVARCFSPLCTTFKSISLSMCQLL